MGVFILIVSCMAITYLIKNKKIESSNSRTIGIIIFSVLTAIALFF